MYDYHICFRHFNVKSLQRFIKDHAKGTCSYCDKFGSVVALSQLADYLEEFIEREYAEPASLGLPIGHQANSPKQQYYLSKSLDTEELLSEELPLSDEDYDKGIIGDLALHFASQYWVKKDTALGPSQKEFLHGGWELFRHIIKHKTRFMFFEKDFLGEFDEDTYALIQSPYSILADVEQAIIDLGLIKTYPKGKLKLFRARKHGEHEDVRFASALGAPPEMSAKANRMSPAGISMFYGAFESKTANAEIIDAEYTGHLTLGEFSNLSDLKLIDFTNLPRINLFDENKRDLRTVSQFMEAFVEDLSHPVVPDDSVHIDYVPTQVVSEYLKKVMGRKYGALGMIYKSVKHKGGRCAVLFLDNSQSVDKNPKIDPEMEIFNKMFGHSKQPVMINKLLELNNETIRTIYIESANGI